jgi:hypothetical protein
MIYIDPPYNKDKDFVYSDTWGDTITNYLIQTDQLSDEGYTSTKTSSSGRRHTNWLNMIYPRLWLSRNLLKDDGVIFVSIDDDEVANLRKVMDEIYGEENFVGDIIRKTKSMTADKNTGFNFQHEYLLIYAKRIENIKLVGKEKDFSTYSNPDNDENGDVGDINADMPIDAKLAASRAAPPTNTAAPTTVPPTNPPIIVTVPDIRSPGFIPPIPISPDKVDLKALANRSTARPIDATKPDAIDSILLSPLVSILSNNKKTPLAVDDINLARPATNDCNVAAICKSLINVSKEPAPAPNKEPKPAISKAPLFDKPNKEAVEFVIPFDVRQLDEIVCIVLFELTSVAAFVIALVAHLVSKILRISVILTVPELIGLVYPFIEFNPFNGKLVKACVNEDILKSPNKSSRIC